MIKQNKKLDWSNYSDTEKTALGQALGTKEPEKAFGALWAMWQTLAGDIIPTSQSPDYLIAIINDCHYLAKWLLACTPQGNYQNPEEILATLTGEELQADLMKFTAINFIVHNLNHLQQMAEQRLAELEKQAITGTGGNNGNLH